MKVGSGVRDKEKHDNILGWMEGEQHLVETNEQLYYPSTKLPVFRIRFEGANSARRSKSSVIVGVTVAVLLVCPFYRRSDNPRLVGIRVEEGEEVLGDVAVFDKHGCEG